MLILLVLCSFVLSACALKTEEATGSSSPAQVEHLDGDNPTRVVLTEEAAQRLDIQTAPVRDQESGGTQFKVVPYAAVLYDPQGATWLYTSPESLTFLRNPIVVDHIEGDLAFLLEGPPSGTAVVTVGAAELFGSESEFEEE